MKKEKITSFLSGVVSCTLVLGLATTALAATGNMSFGRVNVRLNSEEVFAQGEELRTDAGQAIPSSITYTDETGGDTTYVPLSYLSRLLDTPVGWDQASKTVKLGYSAALSQYGLLQGMAMPMLYFPSSLLETDNPSAGLTDLPLKAVGSVAAPFQEVEPIPTDDMDRGISYAIAPTDYTSQEGYENAVPMSVGNGEYCSVTVTNHNSYPLLFTLGRAYNQGSDEIYTHIPAGQTVTRTVKFEKDPNALTSPKLLVAVGYYEAIEDMHISIKAVQFSK